MRRDRLNPMDEEYVENENDDDNSGNNNADDNDEEEVAPSKKSKRARVMEDPAATVEPAPAESTSVPDAPAAKPAKVTMSAQDYQDTSEMIALYLRTQVLRNVGWCSLLIMR